MTRTIEELEAEIANLKAELKEAWAKRRLYFSERNDAAREALKIARHALVGSYGPMIVNGETARGIITPQYAIDRIDSALKLWEKP